MPTKMGNANILVGTVTTNRQEKKLKPIIDRMQPLYFKYWETI